MIRDTRKATAAVLAMFAYCGALSLAQGQLAITEVMSESEALPEYWELTNFGTNAIDLTGYGVADRSGFGGRHIDSFQNVVIQPNESIVFVLDGEVAEFVSIWGPSLTNRVIHQPAGFGINRGGEIFSLWDGQGRLLDSIEVPPAVDGVSFTYNLETGKLDQRSEVDQCGAFKALNSNDVGSPGRHCGPVRLRILREPATQTVDGCDTAVFSAEVAGLPRPVFQWFFDDEPIVDGTSDTNQISYLAVNYATSEHEGRYHVVATSFAGAVTSVVAYLVVNTNPTCSTIVALHSPGEIFEDQTAKFSVVSRGYPCRSYTWYHDGGEILGANGPTLTIPNVSAASVGTYSVVVSNEVCTASTGSVLRLAPWPDLRVTEMMIDVGTNSPGADFWELTNYDTRSIPLTGYKFFDHGAIQSAVSITTQVVIRPGESIVFANSLSRDEFLAWWGATNLPADLQVVSYSGVGFREREELFLWNAAAQAGDDPVAATLWGSNQCVGVSMRFPAVREVYCHTNGEFGAFRSALGDNIGSPGYDAIPRIISTYIVENRVVMRCLGRPSEHYELQRSDSLVDGDWRTVAAITAPDFTFAITNDAAGLGSRQFYRLRQ